MYVLYIYIYIYVSASIHMVGKGQLGYARMGSLQISWLSTEGPLRYLTECTPNLPANIIPTKIYRLNISGKFSMDTGIPPHKFKIVLESNPLSRILVRRLAVQAHLPTPGPESDTISARGALIDASMRVGGVLIYIISVYYHYHHYYHY